MRVRVRWNTRLNEDKTAEAEVKSGVPANAEHKFVGAIWVRVDGSENDSFWLLQSVEPLCEAGVLLKTELALGGTGEALLPCG